MSKENQLLAMAVAASLACVDCTLGMVGGGEGALEYHEIPTAGLVAHWPLDTVQNSTVEDESGSDHDGTLVGQAKGSRCEGRFNGALEMAPGSSIQVEHDNAFLPRDTGLTVAAWVNVAEGSTGPQALVSKNEEIWGISLTADGLARFAACGTSITSTTTIEPGDWHQVVGTYNRERLFLYVDGQLEASTRTSEALRYSVDPVVLGGDPADDSRGLNGSLDDVAIYDRALSPTELEALAAGAAPVAMDETVPTIVLTEVHLRGEAKSHNGLQSFSVNQSEVSVAADNSWTATVNLAGQGATEVPFVVEGSGGKVATAGIKIELRSSSRGGQP